MIEDVLKQHKPGEKPRFFLHDEMKSWLKDNLDIKVVHGENRSADYTLQSKLGLNNSLPVGHYVHITLSIAEEPIIIQSFNLPLPEYEQSFRCLANVSEKCMIEINRLISEVQILQQRIQELEKK